MKLDKISSFDPAIHKNPHYLINYGINCKYMSGVFYFISDESKKIILEHKLPILLFYPCEYANGFGFNETLINSIADARDQNDLLNVPLKVLSVSSYFNKDYQPISYHEMHNELKQRNMKWVQSISFLELYNKQSETGTYHSTLHSRENKILLSDHDASDKNNLFLSLNNTSRTNRILLMLTLHANKKSLAKHLCSQRFDLRSNWAHFILNSCLDIKEYNLTDLRKKLENFDLTALDNYISNSAEDSLDKTISEIFRIIKKDDMPDIKFLDEIDNGISWNWQKEMYLDTWCSVVTETYDNSIYKAESPMISEKTVKAILNYHPFYIFGHTYNNRILADLGFKIFDETWFGMPPDGAEGNNSILERLHNLMISLKKLSLLSNHELRAKWEKIKPDLEYNYDLLLKNDWTKKQVEMILNAH